MPRDYGREDDGDAYGGSGGAAGRYGSQTPLDPLHRQNIFETDERARLQAELEINPSDLDRARAPFDAER